MHAACSASLHADAPRESYQPSRGFHDFQQLSGFGTRGPASILAEKSNQWGMPWSWLLSSIPCTQLPLFAGMSQPSSPSSCAPSIAQPKAAPASAEGAEASCHVASSECSVQLCTQRMHGARGFFGGFCCRLEHCLALQVLEQLQASSRACSWRCAASWDFRLTISVSVARRNCRCRHVQ